jgi:hypothetical protein
MIQQWWTGTGSRWALAAVLTGTLILAGCDSGDGGNDDPGGGPDPNASAPGNVEPADGDGPDPCSLLTEADVSDVAGAEVTGVEGPTSGNRGMSCKWTFPSNLVGEVALSVWVGSEFYPPGTITEGFEEVPGIADTAHRTTGGGLVCTMLFLSGEIVVGVYSTGAGDDACVDLGRIAAGRV